jgi:RNA polymerase sigma-70 factor (ECF subfamily)
VRHLIASGEDARDIVQDVYVDAWRAAQRGSPPFDRLAEAEIDTAAIRRWLFRVAYRQAIDLARRRHTLLWQSLDSADEASEAQQVGRTYAPVAFEDQVAEREVLRAALARLKPEDAACLLLDIVQGFTTAEIAQILGIAPDAARKRLARAMELLRAAYFAPESLPTATPNTTWERADR